MSDEPAPPKKKRGFLHQLAELPMLIVFAFLIAIVIKTFIVQAFFIPSGSMVPSLRVGDRVLVEKLSYRLHDPRRNDVVVFARDVFGPQPDLPWPEDVRNFLRELVGLPTGSEEDFIKRVVAVGGDTIRYEGSPRKLFVNEERVDQSFIANGSDSSSPSLTEKDCRRLQMQPEGRGCRVPAGRIFVMGDNRSNSQDSRFLGPIEEEKIIGRAFVILWPLENFGSL
ncbi:MAG: signal peptidase I [Actinomycetota bacterium]|nr:signal peptidase I [Actinomycetota bacterium]